MLSGKTLRGCPRHHRQQRSAKEKRLDCTFDVRTEPESPISNSGRIPILPRPRMAISSPRGMSQTLGLGLAEL